MQGRRGLPAPSLQRGGQAAAHEKNASRNRSSHSGRAPAGQDLPEESKGVWSSEQRGRDPGLRVESPQLPEGQGAVQTADATSVFIGF